MRLIGFLETEDYVLEFSNNKSTTVEFEGITYEILPYEFKFPFKNPRSSKQQMEAAQSQGTKVGRVVNFVPTDQPAAAKVMQALVTLDPTGISAKAL